MNLPVEEELLFYKLLSALLAFVNRELRVIASASKPDVIGQVPAERRAKLHKQLYAHPELLERFVSENPEKFSPEELNIVASWKYRVSGTFYIMRYLKRYALFMSTEPSHLYGVAALADSFETVTRGMPLPVMVKTTLLPFKTQITYDGLMSHYSVLFGSGIRGSLNHNLNRLKQTEGIIEQLVNLEGVPQTVSNLSRRAKPAPDWKPALEEMVKQTDKMRRAEIPVQTAALSLLRASARLAQATVSSPDEIRKKIKQVRRAMSQLDNLIFEEDTDY